jgi:hypothetical protein
MGRIPPRYGFDVEIYFPNHAVEKIAQIRSQSFYESVENRLNAAASARGTAESRLFNMKA